jgi:amino acid adenylation domain-containing protein
MNPALTRKRLSDADVAAKAEESDVSTATITHRNLQYPASLAQQRFWVLDKLEPGNPALNVAVRWRIEGDLPAELIEKAFAQIVKRHETLRTLFIEIDGEPFQIVQPEVSLRVASIDLTVLAEAEAFTECDRMARMEATTPFDLAIAPLIRVTHVRVRHDMAILLVTVHHAVCDGWSMGLLAHEMGVICASLKGGRGPDLPNLPITYGDYASWQQEVVSGGGLAVDTAYWSRTLQNLEFFALPTDFHRKSVHASAGAIQSRLLDHGLTDRLAVLARQRGCTLFMLAYAALVTLLYRYTGATDIAVGTQVAGRDQVETENLVGPFINTVVLRADLTREPSFAELLDRARDIVAQALQHQAMPLENVIEALSPKRHPGLNPLCSVNFVYQRSFIENIDYGTFKLVDLPSYSAGALYDPNFFMVERPEGWRLSCEYKTELFEPDTIVRMVGHYQTLLEKIVANPDSRLSEFPLLTEAERQQMLEWNATDAGYPQDKCLHELFEARAAQTPDAVAVVHEDDQLTYEELNAKANRLAHHLRRLGVRPDGRVAICVERGFEMVIGLLAILKAGGAYVPLDPSYPADRLAYMLKDSAPIAILSHSPARAPLERAMVGQSEPPLILDLEADAAAWADQSPAHPEPTRIGLTPRHLAYIIYTSGSTGRPKGVMIEHRNVVRLFAATERWFQFDRKDVWTLFHSFAFDFSVWEIWGALFYGGRLVVVPQLTTRSPREFYNLLVKERVTVLNQTPSAFSQLIAAQGEGKGEHRLRYVVFGGEALEAATLKPWFQDRRNRDTRMINMYGITETTVHVTYYPLESVDTELPGGSRIGRPIPDLRFYILDRHGEPTPIGVPGEIYVGGGGVARGYLNRPDLTAERFIASPFVEGDRLYRSGDLGRYLPDGTIEYLGRNDFQVKIRGFRIELGEIQAKLMQHPGVREAVVLAREDAPGDKRLVAYLTAKDRQTLKDSELRNLVRAELPEYMVPSAFVVLDRFPLTPNGKIDRKALPRPNLWEASKGGPLQPTDELEIQLAQIWRDILGVKSVDASSDFFELGGHSLLAARMLARVEAVFGRRIGLSQLFESPGFTAFANVLRSSPQRDFDFRQVVRMGSRHAERSIFAINNTGIFLTLSRRLNADLAITALQLLDPSRPRDSLPTTIEETAGEYVRMIRKIQPRGPYVLMGWCYGGTLAFETSRQLQDAGEVVSRVFLIDTWIPGYLKRLGWLRSKLADYTYRWGLIRIDWVETRSKQKSFWDFIANRPTLRRFLGRREIAKVVAEPAYAAAETYDRWLLDYTTAMAKAYEPKPISERLTIFRGASEPTGLFLDSKLGWGGMATGGVDLIVIPGDHFTVFKEPGASVMAKAIEGAIRSDVDDVVHDVTDVHPEIVTNP